MKEQVQLLKLVFEFLNSLSEKQLFDLIHKKAKLKFEASYSSEDQEYLHISIDEVCSKLDTFNSREEAFSFLSCLKISTNTLRSIARKFNISLISKDTNTQLIEKIVESVIGSKLRFNTLLNTNLK